VGAIIVLCNNTINAQITAEPDCPTAYPIFDASQPIYFEVNGPGSIDDTYGSLTLYCQSQTSATQFESSSAWFTFTPKYSGELGFYILLEVHEDWEFTLFGNNPDCTDLNNNFYWISCDTSSEESPTNSYTGVGVHPTILPPPRKHHWVSTLYYRKCRRKIRVIYYSYLI